MKIKRFLSGIFAAVMSIVLIAAPLSTAIAADPDPETTDPNADKCIITVNHAATNGAYTAYPIFVGNVEKETNDEGKETGRLLIDNPEFHANLETMIGNVSNVNQITAKDETNSYGLYKYIEKDNKINNVGFIDMIKAYDPKTSISLFSIGANVPASSQAETLANILNLTSSDKAVGTILDGDKTSSFYSAFAEAARMFMVDKITNGSPGKLTDVSESVRCDGGSTSVTIEVKEPGYYLVEFTPDDNSADYEKAPRAVRRSLVLVGKGTALSATINSKDTQNIASVDVTFNENILDKSTCEKPEDAAEDWAAAYDYPTDTDETNINSGWKKNVSAGNGDYVKCRVEVTFPGNIAVYDQYYLAVPIMYGYSNTNTNMFDNNKSIKRQGSGIENVMFYFLDDTGNKKYFTPDNVYSNNYDYADDKDNPTGGVDADKFVANETFVFNDVKKIDESISSNTKLVIEFPVKFERFLNNMTTFGATSMGANAPGFNGSDSSATSYTGDDILLKNYITARAVYSNNPNLKMPVDKEGNTLDDEGKNKLTGSEKLYLDTAKEPGALQNPVGVAKESSANIVTYRLRVHATTEDIKDKSYGGVEGVYFAIKNEKGQYAKVHKIHTSAIRSYDEVDNEKFYTDAGQLGNYGQGYTNLYTITEWVDVEKDSVYKKEDGSETIGENYVMQTNNAQTAYKSQKATYNTGRFEIIGLAPGTYTVVALEEAIKAREDITNNTTDEYKEYSISKEGGQPKTEYKFSFAPTLSETCTKLLYNIHYAPSNFDLSTLNKSTNCFNDKGEYNPDKPTYHSVNTTGLIENYNMKWYDKDEDEITIEENKPEWWLGQRNDVALMSMRITYIKKGLSLPVTGGIGTFIFYAVGGVIVLLSTVALITKFRIKRERL